MKKVQVVLVRLRTNFKNWNQMLLFGKRKYVEVFLMTSEEVHLCQDSKVRQGSQNYNVTFIKLFVTQLSTWRNRTLNLRTSLYSFHFWEVCFCFCFITTINLFQNCLSVGNNSDHFIYVLIALINIIDIYYLILLLINAVIVKIELRYYRTLK